MVLPVQRARRQSRSSLCQVTSHFLLLESPYLHPVDIGCRGLKLVSPHKFICWYLSLQHNGFRRQGLQKVRDHQGGSLMDGISTLIKWKPLSCVRLCNPSGLLGAPLSIEFSRKILEWVAIPFSRESSLYCLRYQGNPHKRGSQNIFAHFSTWGHSGKMVLSE